MLTPLKHQVSRVFGTASICAHSDKVQDIDFNFLTLSSSHVDSFWFNLSGSWDLWSPNQWRLMKFVMDRQISPNQSLQHAQT